MAKSKSVAPGTLADALAGMAGTKDLPPESPFSTTEETITVLDSATLSKEQVFKVLTEAQKIDMTVTLKSKESDPLEFNSLQIPQQEAIFVYQHWSKNESDITAEEDPSKDPLLTQRLREVPRYIELRWESLSVIDQTTENHISQDSSAEKIKEAAFRNPRGIGNLANSITPKPIGNSSKNLNMTNDGTVKGKIVDIHEIEKGFDSVSNRHEFVNSVSTVIKVQQNSVAGLLFCCRIIYKMKLNVNFSSVGFGKVFKNAETISGVVPNKQTVLDVANVLSETTAPRGLPIEFKSTAELVGVDYVGYVIEKERFDSKTHSWIKIDEYKLVGSKSNVFRDTRVAYGVTYRYRMKSVLKATIKKEIKNLNSFSTKKDLQKFVTDKVQESLVQSKNLLLQVQKQGNDGLALKTSEGVAEISVEISDSVRAVLNADNTFKLVDSVNNLSLDFLHKSMSDEQFLKSFNVQQQVVEKEFEYVSIYYESNPSKTWTIVDVVKLEPPNFPQTIKIFPNSLKKEVIVSWLKPVSDAEVRFYNVYRREKVNDVWDVVAEGLKEFETLFVDKNVTLGQKYIYAISSIDVHGIESFLSTQIQVEMNANIAIEKKEKDLVWISGGGTSLDEVGLVLKKFFERRERLVATKNIKIRPNTKFREESKDFIVRIKSLDTHEQFDLKVTLRSQRLQGNE